MLSYTGHHTTKGKLRMDMTLAEFGRYCKKVKPSYFVYLTDNQVNSGTSFMRIVWRCKQMVLSLQPNRLCFIGNGNCISFEGVKYIRVFEREHHKGEVFNIFCPGKQKDFVYTMMIE